LIGEADGDKEVLFCYGNPGVGKTFIRYHNKYYSLGRKEREPVVTIRDNSSLILVVHSQTMRPCQGTKHHCFYFEYAARKEQSATNMPGSLLKYMLAEWKAFPGKYLEFHYPRYDKSKRRPTSFSTASLW